DERHRTSGAVAGRDVEVVDVREAAGEDAAVEVAPRRGGGGRQRRDEQDQGGEEDARSIHPPSDADCRAMLTPLSQAKGALVPSSRCTKKENRCARTSSSPPSWDASSSPPRFSPPSRRNRSALRPPPRPRSRARRSRS